MISPRANIADMQAYQSARSIATEAKVFQDANECPGLEGLEYNRYPTPQPKALLARLSEIYKIGPSCLLVGRGSDEGIDLLIRIYCEPSKDKILITPPTYGMYQVSANIQNAEVIKVPLIKKALDNRYSTWDLDTENIVRNSGEAKIIFLCSPNNPTGSAFSLDTIQDICLRCPNSLIVVDQAYIEFCPDYDCTALVNKISNLCVLRTLSKAWGLAGLRCGSLIASPEVILLAQKARAPYPLPQPVIDLVMNKIDSMGFNQMLDRVQLLNSERERLKSALTKMTSVSEIFESHANFLLVRFTVDAMQAARSKGILLRQFKNSGISDCVRISIGTPTENTELINLLENL